jgi:acetyl esterase
MRAVLARLAEQAGGGPSRYDMPFPEARAALEAQRVWWNEGAPTPAETRADTRSFEGRTVGLRHYVPTTRRAGTKIVYLHGGGFCVGSWRTHDGIHRHLAHASGLEVIAVDYALAPEHPFPAGLTDVRSVIDALLAARERVVVAGDSAGANLALVDAMLRRDAGTPLPDALVLYYGTYGPVRRDGSFGRWGLGGYGLTLAALDRYAAAYAPDAALASDPRVHPLAGDVRGLPQMLLVAAGCDPLLDDTLALDAKLAEARVSSTLASYRGVTHGFLAYGRLLDAAGRAFAQTGRYLRERLPRG